MISQTSRQKRRARRQARRRARRRAQREREQGGEQGESKKRQGGGPRHIGHVGAWEIVKEFVVKEVELAGEAKCWINSGFFRHIRGRPWSRLSRRNMGPWNLKHPLLTIWH